MRILSWARRKYQKLWTFWSWRFWNAFQGPMTMPLSATSCLNWSKIYIKTRMSIISNQNFELWFLLFVQIDGLRDLKMRGRSFWWNFIPIVRNCDSKMWCDKCLFGLEPFLGYNLFDFGAKWVVTTACAHGTQGSPVNTPSPPTPETCLHTTEISETPPPPTRNTNTSWEK